MGHAAGRGDLDTRRGRAGGGGASCPLRPERAASAAVAEGVQGRRRKNTRKRHKKTTTQRDTHAGTVHATVRTAGVGRFGLSWAGTRNQRIGPHSRSPRALRPRLANLVQYELTKQISMSRLIAIHPENPQP